MNRIVQNTKLLEVLPENLRNDPDIKAAAEAIDLGFLSIAEDVNNIIIIPRVDEVSEALLDHLAYYFHVDFYDLSLEVDTKRRLVKESVYIHQIKGTPLAVEMLIQSLFGDGEVSEWFDYGGEPYFFRVVTNNDLISNEKAAEFIRALDSVKNARSLLDKVILLQNERMDLYWGGFVHIGSIEEYRQVR